MLEYNIFITIIDAVTFFRFVSDPKTFEDVHASLFCGMIWASQFTHYYNKIRQCIVVGLL
jgi:hypothetical protein